LAALILAIAGGLGYLFSLGHHTVFWLCGKYGVDHRAFVREALGQKWMRIVLYGEWRDLRREHVTRKVAEDVILILCYRPGRTREATDPELGETLVRRMDAMSDLMNGLGAGFIAVICAGALWAALYFGEYLEPLPSSCIVLIKHVPLVAALWLGLFGLHLSNYWRVRNLLARLVRTALATHFARTDMPAVIFVDRSALKRKHQKEGQKALPVLDLPSSS
jgi:hypothetical protein